MEWDGSPDGAYKIFVPLSMLLKYNCGGSTGNRDFVEMKTEQSSSKPLIAGKAIKYLCVWVAAHQLMCLVCAPRIIHISLFLENLLVTYSHMRSFERHFICLDCCAGKSFQK